jgi:hypothetical protein
MEEQMNWTVIRLLTYLSGLAASGLALYGLADFDPATGMLDLHPIDLYGFIGAAGGVLSSGLAAISVWKGWGRK